jgi:3-hydroxyacyl-CoA dehydrogenase/enoyl-CoA hydratase/3-hydroxybutyryl-CoA epimerase
MSILQSTYDDETGLLTIAFEKGLDGEIVFTVTLFREMRELLERSERSKKPKGILLKLEGLGGHTAYPVGELLTMDENGVRRFCYEGQETLKKLRGMGIFTSCILEGVLSGPALEMALACRRRVMSSERGGRIDFPEMSIGIFPPLGGVLTLVEILGTAGALELLLRHESLTPARALEMGLVDHVSRSDEMEDRVHALLCAESGATTEEEPAESLKALARTTWSRSRVRNILFLRKQVRKAKSTLSPGTREACLGLLGMLRESLSSGEDEGLMVGAKNFTDLVLHPPSRNLFTLAGTGAHLKGWVSRIAKRQQSSRRLITVIGDSRRAVEWVVLFSGEGCAVRLVTDDAARTGRILKERIRGREDLSRNIFPTLHSEGLRTGGLVIAATEENDVEKLGGFLATLVEETSSSVPIAVDTASLSGLLSEIPFPSRHRVYGVSRFRFVQGKGIIEVSLGRGAEEENLPDLLSFFHALEPLTILVRESPAGLARRIFTAYVTEALRLVGEGAGILRVEEVAVNSGIPVGPFWMLDVTGLSEYLAAAEFLKLRLGPRFAPPETALRLKEMGMEGRDGEKGFYHRTNGELWLDESLTRFHGSRGESEHPHETIQERLLLAIVAEALRAFGESVTSNPEVVDCALDALGVFPSQLGGPLHYAEALGTPQLIRKFERMYRTCGPAFEPPELLYARLSAPPARDPLSSKNHSYHDIASR